MADKQGSFFDRNWQTNNCGCDLQGCHQCDPSTEWYSKETYATSRRKQAKLESKLQSEFEEDASE